MMIDERFFKVEKEGPILWLILNRPEMRNRMPLAFFDDLVPAFASIDRDPETRVVVIRAEGPCFTVGLDLVNSGAEILGDGSALSREKLRRRILELQGSTQAIDHCRVPVIAAIHGYCIGGGIDLTSACDIRLATRDALFSVRETKIGIVADLGTLQRLPSLIGYGLCRELALTGRDFTAPEALQMGFITHLAEDREALYAEARRLAGEIAANPPLAVQGVKDVLNYTRDHGISQSLTYVAQKNAAAIPSEDLLEAVAAFLEKRKPVFKGR
jgi:enoyl-CoA hydratase/carnithine racemase